MSGRDESRTKVGGSDASMLGIRVLELGSSELVGAYVEYIDELDVSCGQARVRKYSCNQ
ncbi:hypothetical protein EMIT051CA3_100100 [Pseudomonas chlororaphis]